MSWVTNIILTFSYLENEIARIREANNYRRNPGDRQIEFHFTPVQIDTGKRIDRPVYVAAANHMYEVDQFIKHLREKVSWAHPEHVRCFICDQEDEAFEELFQTKEATIE